MLMHARHVRAEPPAAKADDADRYPVVGAEHARVARGRKGQSSAAGRSRLQKIPSRV
ncbi:MAG: hypothetical protein WBC05_15570 [Sedimentisphaerales bacterium]